MKHHNALEPKLCRDGLWRVDYVNGCINTLARGYKSRSAAQRASNDSARKQEALADFCPICNSEIGSANMSKHIEDAHHA